MKKIILTLAIIFSLFIPSFVWAEDAAPITSANQVMSPEEIVKLREQLKQMGQLVGATSAAPSVSAKPVDDHKTVGDVADKALDMFSGVVASIATNIQNIAPHLWRIMIIQQYTKAVGDLVIPFGLLIIAISYLVIIRKMWKPCDEDTKWERKYTTYSDTFTAQIIFRTIIPTIAVIICGVVFMFYLSDSIKYLINPEYYAVKDILTMVLHP
jgi:hypothetical protein